MKILALLLTVCNLSAITIPLPPPGTLTSDHRVSVSDFNGLHLTGQSEVLEFDWSGFVRVYEDTPYFSAMLVFQTSDNSYPGFIDGTGKFYNELGQVHEDNLGCSSSDTGRMACGLFIFTLPETPATDVYSVRFDLSLPFNPDVFITSGEFWLISNGQFGVGPNAPPPTVPDQGGVVLLAISLLGLGCMKRLTERMA